jgi:4-hydroxybenzoate polyprenyltransferase
MSALLRFYMFVNVLSLDVVGGAMISALFFARVFKVTILPYGLAALGLSVWIIYTADHLRDARHIGRHASSRRHAFHQKHAVVLTVLLLVAIGIDVVMIFFVRRPVLLGGIVLSAVILLYLLLQRRYYFLKEIFVASLYLFGILLPSFVVTPVQLTTAITLIILQFFFISLLNLYIFSWYDADQDTKDNLGSFVIRFGSSRASLIIRCLFAIVIIVGLYGLIANHFRVQFVIPLLMSTVLLLVFAYPRIFLHNESYRLLGDAVFFLPAIALICPG